MMRGRRLAYDVADIGRMARDAQFEARMRVEELLASVNVVDIDTTVHVAKGHTDDVIASLVGSLEPLAVVMGSLGRQGIQGIVVGNTVERIARRSLSPVLAVKPNGLRNPSLGVEQWSAQALPY